MLGADGSVRNVLKLPWGAAPISVILTPDSTQGFVGLYGSGQIQKFDPITQVLGKTLTLGTTPRAMAITADGKRLLVSQFISTDGSGTVRTVELDSFAKGQVLTLPLDSTTTDGSIAARGLPNYLAGLAIDPSGGLAWAVGKKDNILRGLFRDGKSLTFETTVRALLSPLDLNVNQEITVRRVDLDNLSQPSAITLNETGTRLFVTLQGNNKLAVLNQLGREITRAETGLAPQGIVIDYATGRVFTQDFMDRTVSVFDGTALLKETGTSFPRLAQIPGQGAHLY
jgi:DNA-binding beta-propeller fold protein YncE